MKKLFTPLLLFLTVLLGGINASAADQVLDLTADMFFTWTGFDQNAVKGNQYEDVEFNIGNDKELSGGNVVCGTGGVFNTVFADLTGSSKLIVEGTAGMRLSVSMNRQADNSLEQPKVTIGDNGILEMDLANYAYVHINTIKLDWGSPSGVINSIKYVMPEDPLAVPKQVLKQEIDKAKLYNGIAYTEDSYNALQSAISNGESKWQSATTVDALQSATTAIEEAIEGLTHAKGYSDLTKEMFLTYASVENPGEGSNPGDGCAYNLFTASEGPYGNGNVSELMWADLSEYDKLIIATYGSTKPRIMMNRLVKDGQQAATKEDSKMLDINPNNAFSWSTEAYQTIDGNVYTINLKKISEDFGFVRLHSIKKQGWGDDVFVTGMYLYKAADPLEMPKAELTENIEKAKLYDSFAKTELSWNALQTAIKAAEDEVASKAATAESLAAASRNLAEAVEKLTLEEGYEYLTAEMFKEYTSYEKPDEGKDTNGAYKLFESTNNPYGTGGSDNNRWADLSGYDKLIVTFKGDAKPRVWINRSEYNGQDGTSKEDAKMLDMQAGNGKWSTKEYTAFEQDNDNNINIFTVDLNKIKTDYNKVARLHGIKYSGSAEGIITGMYLYKSNDELEMPKEALQAEIDKAQGADKYLKTDESWNALQDAIAAGKDELENANATKESLEAAAQEIQDALNGLQLLPGYSDLTTAMFKHYESLENPGEGESTGCDYNLNQETGSVYGDCNNVGHQNWADLTDYDQLIIKLEGDTKPRVMINRMGKDLPDADNRKDSKMLEMHPDYTRWSTVAYTTYDADKNIFTVKVKDIVDDYGFARLNAIKYPGGQQGVVTGVYLYKDATEEFNLSFNVDDPSHVVVKVNDATQTLKAGDNEVTVANRAQLSISPADKFKIASLTANDEQIDLSQDGTYSKVIVKAISFKIVTEDANPLAPQIKDLNTLIEKAKLYDEYLKTKTSWDALQKAIADAEAEVENEGASKESLEKASANLNKAITGLELIENHWNLTAAMYKKYASLDEPGEGEDTDCAYVLFEETDNAYGNSSNNAFEWADLSDYDTLIITTYGNDTKPLISLNRLEEKGEQAATQKDSKMIDINPYANNYNWSTDKYQTIENNSDDNCKAYTYIIDLKQIVKDFGFARLHSIRKSGWNTMNPSISGMYLYKAPYVDVEGITLDKATATVTKGETIKLTATVLPEDATEPDVTWTSSDNTIATVDENGNVKAVGVGKVTITAKAGDETAECAIKCYPQKGDATLDGSVSITDAIHIANYIVGKQEVKEGWEEKDWLEFYPIAANANGSEDGKITISDATATVKIALEQQSSSDSKSRILPISSYYDAADNLVIGQLNTTSNAKTSVAVTLDNSIDYVAIQADIYVPEGVSFDVMPGRRITDEYTFQAKRFADNHVRVAIYTFSGVAFADNNEPLFEIVADSYLSELTDIALVNILASDADSHECALGSRYEDVTGVVAIGFDSNAPVKVYDLNGRYISDKVDGLEGGFYIIRQGDKAKKVRIR